MKQKIQIIGNLGQDPNMRYTPSGDAVVNFSIAANKNYTNSSGEKVKDTTWFKVEAWGKLAESINQYCTKGKLVEVEGRMKPTRIWTDNEGNPRCDLEVRADQVLFLSRSDDNGSNGSAPRQQTQVAPAQVAKKDDTPW